MKYLVTGGAGFIGSALVRRLIAATDHEVLVVDKLTYAGNLSSLADVSSSPRYTFLQADIADAAAMTDAMQRFSPDVVMNLAAESHVDRSIDNPGAFIITNVVGTFTLLDAALAHWRRLEPARQADFRFLHVSTDEVFGALGAEGHFTEASPYAPSSPYSASKAGADHLVAAWHRTYGLPTLLTNCSNNYGPFHFPEKLIPLTIINALLGKPILVYGSGSNVRDWLHVSDHVDALLSVVARGAPGSSFAVGGHEEHANIDVVRTICDLIDNFAPDAAIGPRRALITLVTDRPGHDHRYAIDAGKIRAELGWQAQTPFADGLRATVAWFLANRTWWQDIRSNRYQGDRLGTVSDKTVDQRN